MIRSFAAPTVITTSECIDQPLIFGKVGHESAFELRVIGTQKNAAGPSMKGPTNSNFDLLTILSHYWRAKSWELTFGGWRKRPNLHAALQIWSGELIEDLVHP